MKKTPYIILLICVALTVTASTIIKAPHAVNPMITRWELAKPYTKDYLDAMPEEFYSFRATPEMRTYAQQYLHIAGITYRLLSIATGTPNPYPGDTLEHMPEMQSKKAVIDVTMKSYDAMIEELKKMSDEQLQEKLTVFGNEMTKDDVLFKAYENQAHHRGQTTVYLRLKGIKPPAEK